MLMAKLNRFCGLFVFNCDIIILNGKYVNNHILDRYIWCDEIAHISNKMLSYKKAYQGLYGLKHYNLLETGSFLIRKLNQSTSCLMLQFKGKNTLKLPFLSNFK